MKREHDEVGWLTEMKLEIVRDYAKEYSKIMSRQAGFQGEARDDVSYTS